MGERGGERERERERESAKMHPTSKGIQEQSNILGVYGQRRRKMVPLIPFFFVSC